ncbi:MAG: porin [Planctomycetaceae bacterium]|nr:porin [Planctomycetaceae bacterium]
MRHGRISELIRRSAGALLLLGSFGVSSDTLIFAQDANCATPAPACTPQCSDDVYKRAGERLAQQLQQMGSQPCGQTQCGAGCAPAAPGCANAGQPGCLSDGCAKGSCLFGGLSHGDGCAEEKKDPWTLMSVFDDECGKNCLKDKGITIAGWVQVGYSSAPDGAFTGNGPFLDDREWNNVNLNQMYLYVAKVADGSKGFDWGYRADIVYGVDGNDTQSFGNNPGRFDFLNGWDHGIYEWAMPQLYGEVAMGNLSVKLGHFYTPIGYEVVTSPDNFFFSKQVTFYNSEPFTHTGALGTYKVNDKLTLIGGATYGWDTGFDQFNGATNAIFGATYAASDKTTLVYAAAVGEFGVRGDGAINSFILSQKWTDKLMTVHQFDVLDTNSGNDLAGAGTTAGDSTGFINYAFYQLTDKAKAGVRYEWYKADGTSYNTLTYGVNYQLTPNVVVRPEGRHNWAPGNDVTPWNEDIFGIDAIFKF